MSVLDPREFCRIAEFFLVVDGTIGLVDVRFPSCRLLVDAFSHDKHTSSFLTELGSVRVESGLATVR